MRLVQAKTSGLTTIRAENAVSPVKVLRTNNTSGPIMRLVGKNRATDCIMTRSLDALRRPGLHKYQKRLTSQDSV